MLHVYLWLWSCFNWSPGSSRGAASAGALWSRSQFFLDNRLTLNDVVQNHQHGFGQVWPVLLGQLLSPEQLDSKIGFLKANTILVNKQWKETTCRLSKKVHKEYIPPPSAARGANTCLGIIIMNSMSNKNKTSEIVRTLWILEPS